MLEYNAVELTANWFIDKDPDNKGIDLGWNFNISETAVPTVVPSIIQETLPEYHGVAFYWCKFSSDVYCENNGRMILRFKGVDYKAIVWLNGVLLGEHEGGETPFDFDVTETLKEENLLAVRVLNPIEYDIDGLNIANAANRNKTIRKSAGCCLNSGGIWYGVELYSVPAVYVYDKFAMGDIHSGKLTVNVDLRNTVSASEKVTLSLSVYGKTDLTHKIVEKSLDLSVDCGDSSAEIELTVPNVRLWDINDPFLYRVDLCLTSAYGESRESFNFGFREFKVVDGYFCLNGRKIFLKCSHSGNAFPIGQNYPVVKEQVRQDMIMAKTYGFNAVRAISGTFRPEQLDVCDEIGLLIYEESLAAWQLGESRWMLKDEKSSDLDQEKMFRRFDVCTIEMVKRDRNHPSLVIWGLLNEMFIHNPISEYAENFLPKIREVDPSRLILLHSGRWDRRKHIASGSNPYSQTWDAYMGADGNEAPEKEDMINGLSSADIGDYHYYPDYPMGEKDIAIFRNYAKDHLPAFISESGIGP